MKPAYITFRMVLSMLLINLALLCDSQTFEEFKKQREAEFEAFKNRETEAMKRLQAQYDQWVEERDREFAAYLEGAWEEYKLEKEMERPDNPKPDVIPEFEKETVDRETFQRMPVIKTEPLVEKPREKPRIKPVIQKSEPVEFRKFDINFQFYGVPVMLDFDQTMRIPAPVPVKNSSITEWWKKASKTNYNHLVNQLFTYKSAMALNDWGFYQLIMATCERIQANDRNGMNLLSWFLLNRSGYNAKIAYAGSKTSLLIPSEQVLYGKQFFSINGIDFYIMEPLGTNVISSYARDYYDATRLFDFRIDQPMNLGEEIAAKTISVEHEGKLHRFNLLYDQNIVEFYRDYPQVDLEVYFDAPVSMQTKTSVAENLLPIVEEMSPVRAVNFLLKLVQNGFEYLKDQEQFGYEKYFFPEETIFYPYSDCEDRSALFAYLVKELLDYRVIGLRFEGHVAAAVNFPMNAGAEGSFYIFQGQKYIITDPTYINAPVGLAMPQYKAADARIIRLASITYADEQDVDFWKLADDAGGYHGSNLEDKAFDSRGNCYLTGYFINNATFANRSLSSETRGRSAFVTSYDKAGRVRWAYAPKGKGISTGMAITLDNESNIMVSGSFRGTLYLGGFTLQSREDRPDSFVAKIDPNGNLVWAGQAGLDSIDQESFMKYIIKYDRAGNYLGRDLYLENNQKTKDGIFTDEEGIVYLAGSLQNTTGFNVKEASYMDLQELDYVLLLKNERDQLSLEHVDEGILGVFAVINVIKSNGMVIPGKAAQQALDKYNPGFRSKSPDIYEKIGSIDFLRNSDGIITMKTEDEDPVVIDKVKVTDGSTVKITSLPNGDEQLDILSGIRVGKLFIWYDLNYIQMHRDSGNLLFDYDDDHTQALVNIREDILD